MRPANLIVTLVVAVGLVGTVVAVSARGGDPVFIDRQQTLVPVTAVALQRLIATTHDPRPGHGGAIARAATCTPAGGPPLGNPWSCVVSYSAAPAVRYRVIVHSNLSIVGVAPGALSVKGCCVHAIGV